MAARFWSPDHRRHICVPHLADCWPQGSTGARDRTPLALRNPSKYPLQVEWDNGRALAHLLDALGLEGRDDVLPIYIGDDR